MPIEDERLGQAAERNCGDVRDAADERHLFDILMRLVPNDP